MDQSYVLTFTSDDRPGLVESLSEAIEASGGNWLESRLCQLAGKFAGVVLVSVPADRAVELESGLEKLRAGGLDVQATPATAEASGSASDARARQITLAVMGPDRPGIVREVARALADRRINVVDMESHVAGAPMSGERLFNARIEAHIPVSADLDNLSTTLEEIADQMTLEIDLES